MILSEKHKFVFIKGRKVASTSVEVLLSKICGTDDIITPITPIDERKRVLSGAKGAQNYGADENELAHYLKELTTRPSDEIDSLKIPKGKYRNHMPLSQVISTYGKITDGWRAFAVERCPYRKIISLANMDLKFMEYRKTGSAMISDIDALKTQVGRMFEDGSISSVRNMDLYKTNGGKVGAHILRYEHIEKDLRGFLENVGVKDIPELEHFKKGVTSCEFEISDVFSKRQLEEINRIYSDEFYQFGYSMEW